MRLPQAILFLITLFTLGHALALPGSLNDLTEASKQLFKRKGGGGGGGRGGSSSSSSSSTSSSSSSGGTRGSGSSGSTSSSSGGTRAGTGSTRGYGGGAYYGGGASTPYKSGNPRTGLGAPLLLGAGVGALAVFPALALYGAYSYGYPYYWTYRNQTSGQNETHPAQCYCARYSLNCGCDANNNTDYQNAVANNATAAKLVNINGTQTLAIDGTLSNDTTAPGTSDTSGAGSIRVGAEMLGWWPMVAAAGAMAYVL